MILPPGTGASVTELLVRQILLKGIVDLASDSTRLDHLFARVDGLPQGSQAEWVDTMKALLKQAVTDPSVRVQALVGYPRDASQIPCWSIVKEGGSENTGQATHGDEFDYFAEREGTIVVPGSPNTEWPLHVGYTVYGHAWTSNFQVGTWAPTPDVSILLHEAALEILDVTKGELDVAGVQNVTISEPGGWIPDFNQFPGLAVGYIPLVRLSVEWTRIRLKRQSPRPNHVRRHTSTVTT